MIKRKNIGTGSDASITTAMTNLTIIAPRSVDDLQVHARESLFREALHQTKPLAEAGSGLEQRTVKLVQNGNARHALLKEDTARRLITDQKNVKDLLKGRYPSSTPAEVVVAHDYKIQNAGGDAGIVNPAQHHSSNVVDVRISPDSLSRRDILFLIEDHNTGLRFYRSGGQVKTGASDYLTKTLKVLPDKLDYGQTAYVDAKYVNSDGSPRVAADAFTNAEAKHLNKSKVRLRGIKDLEKRAEKLTDDILSHANDGLSPESRAQLQQLHDDIAQAYKGSKLIGRAAGGAAIAAVSAALLSLIMQIASGGEIDITEIRDASIKGAGFGAGGALIESGLYHGAEWLGSTPETARSFAQQGVATGFCLIAVCTDIWSEVDAAKTGEISNIGAISGSCAKTALDLLPFVLAPLGLWGVPLLIGSQLGGRWVISRLRAQDDAVSKLIIEDLEYATTLNISLTQMIKEANVLQAECDSTDEIYQSVMSNASRLTLVY